MSTKRRFAFDPGLSTSHGCLHHSIIPFKPSDIELDRVKFPAAVGLTDAAIVIVAKHCVSIAPVAVCKPVLSSHVGHHASLVRAIKKVPVVHNYVL